MTGAIAFDTHRFVKRLTEGGFTEKQAETLAEEHVALLNTNLATKADIAAAQTDLAAVEAGLKADLANAEAGLKTEIAKVEAGLKEQIAKVEAGLKAEIAKVETGLKAEIAKVEGGVETLRLETGARIAKAEAELKGEIAKAEGRLKAEIAAVKADLLKWMFGAMIAQGGLIVALVKLL